MKEAFYYSPKNDPLPTEQRQQEEESFKRSLRRSCSSSSGSGLCDITYEVNFDYEDELDLLVLLVYTENEEEKKNFLTLEKVVFLDNKSYETLKEVALDIPLKLNKGMSRVNFILDADMMLITVASGVKTKIFVLRAKEVFESCEKGQRKKKVKRSKMPRNEFQNVRNLRRLNTWNDEYYQRNEPQDEDDQEQDDPVVLPARTRSRHRSTVGP